MGTKRGLLQEIILASETVATLHGRPRGADALDTTIFTGLFERADSLKETLPTEDHELAFGVLPDADALWLRRKRAESDLKLGAGVIDVFRSQAYNNRLMKSWRAISEGKRWDSTNELLARRLELLRERLKTDFGIEPDHPFPEDRVFVCGIEEGICWLGYRDGADIAARLLTLDQVERARLLRERPTKLRIESFPRSTELQSWWKIADTSDAAIVSAFQTLVCDLLRSVGSLTDIAQGLSVLRESPSFRGPAIIVYPTECSVVGMNHALAQARPALRTTNARSLIVCVPAGVETAMTCLKSPEIVGEGYAKRPIVVLGFEHVRADISLRPWLWSKHFGPSAGFRLFFNDPFGLLTSMTPDAMGRRVLRKSDAPRHPEIAGRRLSATVRLRIIGRPGTGKSSAMYQLLRDVQKNALIVLLPPRMDASALRLLKEILHGVPAIQSMRIFVGIDNLDRVDPKDDDCSLRALLRISREAPLGASLGLIVTYDRTEARQIAASYAGLFQDMHLHRRLLLDYPPRDFVFAVAHAFADARHLALVEVYRNGLVSNVYRYENSLSTLTTLLDRCLQGEWRLAEPDGLDDPRFIPPALERRRLFWLSKFEGLLARSDATKVVMLLELMACLDFIGYGDPATELVQAYFCDFKSGSHSEFHSALRALVQDGWIQEYGPELHTDRCQLLAVTEEMDQRGVLAKQVLALLNWTITSRALPSGTRETVLRRACGKLEKAPPANDALLDFVRHVVFDSERFDSTYLRWLMDLRRHRHQLSAYALDLEDLVAARPQDHAAILSAVAKHLQIALPAEEPSLRTLWPVFERAVFGSSSPFPTELANALLQEIDRAIAEPIPWNIRARQTGRPLYLGSDESANAYVLRRRKEWQRIRDRCVRRLARRTGVGSFGSTET